MMVKPMISTSTIRKMERSGERFNGKRFFDARLRRSKQLKYPFEFHKEAGMKRFWLSIDETGGLKAF